jgi:glycosyltransferase involved in cell wall biosynthesis
VARVLWVSVELPDRNGQGGQRRQYHQIRALVEHGHDVTVLTPRSGQDGTSIRRIVRTIQPRIAVRGRVLAAAVRRLQRHIVSPEWDAVVVSHHESWWLVPRDRARSTPILLDIHNVMSEWHRAAGRVQPAKASLDEESVAIEGATAVTTCSPVELERLRAAHPVAASKSFAAPLGVDPAEWPVQTFDRANATVALFGSWGWRPNALGLAWFLSDVWPRVVQRVPDAVALVAGSDASGEHPWPSGARFVGRVADVAAFTAAASVVAVPVIEGVGASVKFAEALATGAAVVATPDGANAFANPPAFVSSDAGCWSDWIVERLRHRAEEPAPARSRQVALRDYTWSRAVEPIDAWLRSVTTSDEVGKTSLETLEYEHPAEEHHDRGKR